MCIFLLTCYYNITIVIDNKLMNGPNGQPGPRRGSEAQPRGETKMARAKEHYFYRAGKVRKLKPGVSVMDYVAQHPDAVPSCKPPTLEKLERWERDGYGRTPCGCKVEPDGYCQHNVPSWLIIMGFI